MKADITEQVLSVAALLGSVFAAIITKQEEITIILVCFAAAAAGGLVAVSVFKNEKLTPREQAWRWTSNFLGGAFVGPFLTDYVCLRIEWARPIYTAMFAGVVCGILAVFVMAMLPGFILDYVKSKKGRLP